MAQLAGLKRTIRASIYRGESHYVAECHDLNVVTQGKTLDEAVSNLQEALRLHLEGEDLRDLGFAPDPTLLVTLELEPTLDVA